MHPKLKWLVEQHNCPNCWCYDIEFEIDNPLEQVDFYCCRCDWQILDVCYSDILDTILKKVLTTPVKNWEVRREKLQDYINNETSET